MTRVPVLTKFFIALILLAGITGLVSCSHGGTGTTPATTPELTADSTLPGSPSGDGVTLGYFQFVFDDNEVSVEETSPVRGAEFNVGGKALVILEDFWFDEENRNWHIVATIRNVSIFTGYDVWAVFHSMGNKFVINTDGFLWAMPPVFPVPTRCPFIAYGKDQPNRAYPPGFQDTREIIIHQPTGIPKLAPIGFWVDATVFPRRTPGVEDLMVEPISDTDSTYQLTGFIWDHQSPSEDLVAWADCTHFNGQNYVPLFDDGEHGDGDAGDNIFGATFSGDPDEGPYRLTVYAFDPQEHQGENDVWFLHGGPCNEPLEPIPFETIDKGEHSGIEWEETAVVNDWETWKHVWELHTSYIMPPPPIPKIDFKNHTVIGVWVGWRPSNNHHATITAINFDPCEDLVIVDYVYTPYEACGPLDVMTDPFHIVVTPKFEYDAYFVGMEVPCPPPLPECEEWMPIDTVIHGVHSGIMEPYELRIGNQKDFWALWQQHTSFMIPPPPPPEINWDIHDVAAVGIGNRNTGGFECNIYEFCWLNTGGMGVFYVERIPGPDCNVPQVFTQPHHWILVPKVDSPLFFFKSEEVYSCGGPCEPVPWFQLAEGDVSCAEPGEYGFQDFNQEFEDLWHKVHCWDPDSGDPPPPLPPIPPPTQDGSMKPFIIQAQHFPTTGFFVTIDDVCIKECTLVVNYTLHIPGESCNVGQFPTQPWAFGVAEFPPIKCLTQWEFIGHEEVYECGDCEPIPWYQLAEDEHSCAEQGEYGFQGFNQQFEDLWVKLHCGEQPPLPEIPDPMNPAWEMKPFVIQAPEFPTSGYYLTIDDVCLDGCMAVVEYTLWIPGPGCDVLQVLTQPWVFGVAEFPPIDCEILWKFNGHEEVYECEDCNPVPFWQIADGSHSCAEPGEYGWQYEPAYVKFWYEVNCYDPASGDPPPPLPEDPEPIEGGIIYHAGIQLPHRPSTGYFITFDEVCIEGCDVYIKYTEHIPGPDCNVLWVITQPWAIAAIELPPVYCYWQWHFEKYEEVYDCPDEDCYDFETIAGENFSGGEVPGGWYFDNQQEYYLYWYTYHPGEPMPEINFEGGWGGYAIHLGARPTSGYKVEVFEICAADDPFGVAVRWVEWIPGKTCDVLQVITAPWTLVTMPLVDLPYFDEGYEEVYECD